MSYIKTVATARGRGGRSQRKPAHGKSTLKIDEKEMCPVKGNTAGLAHCITRAASKQTYYTARLMVDKDLVDDFCQAYAYFRWVDDIIDESSLSEDERVSFILRQRELIDRSYMGELVADLVPQEEIVVELIRHDKDENSGLQSFVRNMLAIIEFDAYRKGRLISQKELTWYSECVGKAVTDGIQHFVGHGHPYPATETRYMAGVAAHITHLLRDMLSDMADGFINIPQEYLDAHGITREDVSSAPFRAWVRERVALARQYFRQGKRYVDELDVLRCKIVGYWYCLRFEGVLDTIERDGYVLQSGRYQRSKLRTLFKMASLGVSVSLQHFVGRVMRFWRR